MTLYRAWYKLNGKETAARGQHGSICLSTNTLAKAKLAAARNGHAIDRVRVVQSPGEALVAEFERHLGVHEIGSSNRGPWIDECMQRVHAALGGPWCAASFSCVCEDAGYPLVGGGSASVAQLRERAQQHGRWIAAPSEWREGYGICVSGDEHIGMLISIDHAAGTLSYISGNTHNPGDYNGGQVEIHTMPISVFEGAIRTY